MRAIHLPVWLGNVSRPRAITFAALFSFMTFCRAVLVTVIPLQALSVFGDAQKVSVFYFGVSLAGVLGALAIPFLVQQIKRRWVYTLGAVLIAASAYLMSLPYLPAFIAGMALHVFAAACMEITFNLYLMDHIPRTELGKFEPLRVFSTAGSWVIGPWLGVYLQNNAADWAPYAASAGAAALLLCFFWFLRLNENPAVAPMKAPSPNPMKYLPHFFEQPRLRLAWFLAVGRSGWWAMYFIYAPIYAVQAGLGEEISGAIVSLGTASILIVPFWGWVGRRYGLRKLMIGGYAVSAFASVVIAFAVDLPWLGAAVLVMAAFGTGIIDGGGNVPFLRAVHPLERAQMTSVYATYRDVSQLAPPGVFSLLLQLFALPAVFISAGAGMLTLAYFARYLPRKL